MNYIINRLPELPEIWVNSKEQRFNEQKHKQTCLINKRKRKRRKISN